MGTNPLTSNFSLANTPSPWHGCPSLGPDFDRSSRRIGLEFSEGERHVTTSVEDMMRRVTNGGGEGDSPGQSDRRPANTPIPEALILTLREMLAASQRVFRVGDIVTARDGVGNASKLINTPMIVQRVGALPPCLDGRSVGTAAYGYAPNVRVIAYDSSRGWYVGLWMEATDLMPWAGEIPPVERSYDISTSDVINEANTLMISIIKKRYENDPEELGARLHDLASSMSSPSELVEILPDGSVRRTPR